MCGLVIVLSLEKASSMGERSGEYPGKKRGGFRFCLAEKESLHIPQGLRDAQACGEQVEVEPAWNQGRHDEAEQETRRAHGGIPSRFRRLGGGQCMQLRSRERSRLGT